MKKQMNMWGFSNMIKETVCQNCCYRYSFDTKQELSHCPICGHVTYTRDAEIVRPFMGEGE